MNKKKRLKRRKEWEREKRENGSKKYNVNKETK